MSIDGISSSAHLPVSNNVTGEGPPTTMPLSQQEQREANTVETEVVAPDAGTTRASSEPGLSDALIRDRFIPVAV